MNENLTFIHDFVHFMKWTAKYIWICPFHEMDSWVVHFMKWTICLSISRNGQFHTWVVTYTHNHLRRIPATEKIVKYLQVI